MTNIYIADQIPEIIRTELPEKFTYFNSKTITQDNYSSIEIIWGFDSIAREILNDADSNVKWIQSFSAGADYFPLQQLHKQNVLLTNTSGVHSTAIAETAILYALYFARQFPKIEQMKHAKDWSIGPKITEVKLLSKMNWLIFGTGHIGQEIAQYAKALGSHTIGVNRSGHPADNFDETISMENVSDNLKKADIILNIMPFTKETDHYFNKSFFDQLEKLFLFINVGRGNSLTTTDLIDALNNQNIQYAALDVFEEEPLPSSSPLWSMDNVLITPHNSAHSIEMLEGVRQVFVDNLAKYDDKQELNNLVDLERGY